MDIYADVAKEVEPKKKRLDEMNASLAVTMAELNKKEKALKEVLDRVAALQKTCDETVDEKKRLQEESDTTAKRLVRAEKLTNGLNSEGERWRANIVSLAAEKTNLIGDCFLSCACISYTGAFTGAYRDKLNAIWLKNTNKLKIPASARFSLSNTLGDPVMIREWQNQGLPTDSVSVNNGILVDKCRRWPLMIDPQMQANQWLRKKEEKNNVQITTMGDSNLLRALEKSIRLGLPLLIEDIGEQIEPALEPILQKAIFKQGTRLLIRLGDSDVDYDPNFKLYMTTKMPNPHYLPEVCIKVTLINFTVTMQGLEAQLLGDVVKAERPDIEQKKVQLLLQMADDKKQLAMLEAKILQMLSESEGNILDDEVLINTLAESKLTSIAIGERVAEAEVTEVQINEARAKYIDVATRGSIIYFVIADLGGVDPMYQVNALTTLTRMNKHAKSNKMLTSYTSTLSLSNRTLPPSLPCPCLALISLKVFIGLLLVSVQKMHRRKRKIDRSQHTTEEHHRLRLARHLHEYLSRLVRERQAALFCICVLPGIQIYRFIKAKHTHIHTHIHSRKNHTPCTHKHRFFAWRARFTTSSGTSSCVVLEASIDLANPLILIPKTSRNRSGTCCSPYKIASSTPCPRQEVAMLKRMLLLLLLPKRRKTPTLLLRQKSREMTMR